jgi:polygalacturonase
LIKRATTGKPAKNNPLQASQVQKAPSSVYLWNCKNILIKNNWIENARHFGIFTYAYSNSETSNVCGLATTFCSITNGIRSHLPLKTLPQL